MDRLYREVRLGIITPEMGTVLFKIVTRLLDAGLCDAGPGNNASSGRSRADRIRPKLSELLTRTERTAWRRAIGYVAQETILFNSSIRENIAWSNLEADEAAIIEAAKKAHAHDFIMATEEGYDNRVVIGACASLVGSGSE